jgi:4-oxalomesaconate hydratase
MLVVGAHSADFVWRSAGAIAVHTAAGGVATVVALSYGERGESGELWKEPGQTVENVKRIRHAEATQAAEAIGATFECFDLGDYPLNPDNAALERLTDLILETEPDVIVTHTAKDPFNPDHPMAYALTQRARLLASGAGVASGFKTIRPPEFFLFEPHQPEQCEFQPNTYVDITSVFEKKRQAMAAMAAQKYLIQYYTEQAEHRAYHARRASGTPGIKFAEAFQRVLPQVVTQL